MRPPLISTDICLPFDGGPCVVYTTVRAAPSSWVRRSVLVPPRHLLVGVRGAEHRRLRQATPGERETDRQAVDEAAGDARRGKAETAPRRVERDQGQPVGQRLPCHLDRVLADGRRDDRHLRGGEQVV